LKAIDLEYNFSQLVLLFNEYHQNNYQEELEVHYMEPTKEKSHKRAPVQNKANEGRYSSMNRLLEIRKREFDNDE